MDRLKKSILLFAIIIAVVGPLMGIVLGTVLAAPQEGAEHGDESTRPARDNGNWTSIFMAISAAVVTSCGCIGAAYAVGRVGAAALGAASEKPELLGRSLLFVGLAEGIAIYALIVGIMLIMRI